MRFLANLLRYIFEDFFKKIGFSLFCCKDPYPQFKYKVKAQNYITVKNLHSNTLW